ncbi:MAG: peptidyl-prolyl cis-trans isomerase [Oscillospiraceae bacterium]|nr:peptidyl-prolyl cis-trans isomerase [Oscillospiraceae bacterium]
MSASKEKTNRLASADAAISKKEKAAMEEAQKNRKFRTRAIIFVVALVIAIGVSVFLTSDYRFTKTTAIEVNDNGSITKLSPAQVEYYYYAAFDEFSRNYGSYLSWFIDTSKDFDDQDCTFGSHEDGSRYTWADYFMERAEELAKTVVAFGNDAKAAGFELPEGERLNVDEVINTYKLYAQLYGYNGIDHLLRYSYGEHLNEKIFRQCLLDQALATSYATSVTDTFTVSGEDAEAYYTEHANQLDRITYLSYSFSYSNSVYSEIEGDDAKIAKAREDAYSVIDGTKTEEEFLEKLNAFLTEHELDTKTLDNIRNTYAGENINSDFLANCDSYGETYVVENDYGGIAYFFVGRDDNSQKVRIMRHILIKAAADEDGNITEDALVEAEAKLSEVIVKYNENPTEENFIALCKEYSEDNAADGGIYENIAEGDMVAEINDWLFASERKVGDVSEPLYGSNGSYQGYHFVYYMGEGEDTCAIKIAREKALAEMKDEYYDACVEGVTVTEGKAFKNVAKNFRIASASSNAG